MKMKNQSDLPTPTQSFWNLSMDRAIAEVNSNINGLTEDSARKKLAQHGPNKLKGGSRTSTIVLFLLQFKSPITLLLIGAAALSFSLQDPTDGIIILVIVLVSSVLGWWQEKGAANAVEQLLKMVQIHCRVVRNGQEKEIPVEGIVPGDIVLLTAGDVIPGDSI